MKVLRRSRVMTRLPRHVRVWGDRGDTGLDEGLPRAGDHRARQAPREGRAEGRAARTESPDRQGADHGRERDQPAQEISRLQGVLQEPTHTAWGDLGLCRWTRQSPLATPTPPAHALIHRGRAAGRREPSPRCPFNYCATGLEKAKSGRWWSASRCLLLEGRNPSHQPLTCDQ